MSLSGEQHLKIPQLAFANTCSTKRPGKSCQLYRHDLIALHSKQTHRFSLHMNKIPERLVPRKFALTTKVPDTKGCTQCCVTRNPYNGYKYLCGATPSGIFLMQWYDPLNKFMLLKQCEWPASSILGGGHGCVLNGHTPVFEMIITPELEYPIVCTGVRKALNGCLKLELINMNSESELLSHVCRLLILYYMAFFVRRQLVSFGRSGFRCHGYNGAAKRSVKGGEGASGRKGCDTGLLWQHHTNRHATG